VYREIGYLLVNFGGPRALSEVEPFLQALLTDRDVIRTAMPQTLHNFIFKRVAKKRASKVSEDYAEIGGGSPIFEDTEAVAEALRRHFNAPVLTFHRYLTSTHKKSLEAIVNLKVDEIRVFPMFPQFTYATTGSIARFFHKSLPQSITAKLKWIKSYPTHSAFIRLTQKSIQNFLNDNSLEEENTILLFSAHGVPQSFIEAGDLYEGECLASFQKVMEAFPKILGKLAYQSKFGPGEWLKPYTVDVCEGIRGWHESRENLVFVPISFTSDHIETLFEIEKLYIPIIQDQGLKAYRLPAFNRSEDWIETICSIIQDTLPVNNSMLVRWEVFKKNSNKNFFFAS
jgi:protoporphyrin/coproporphyrin ferrochelatase